MSNSNQDMLVAQLLEVGLDALGIGQAQHALLLDYLLLLNKWNQAYNLTAIRDLPDMVTRHILDSLAIVPYIHGVRVIDVGTGPGLPGIPLAITQPHLDIVLLDSNGKKTRFLNEVKRRPHLDNVQVIQSRVENYRDVLSFDTVVSRAFSDIGQMIFWTQHLLARDGIWLAMKGQYPATELLDMSFPYEVKTYEVPGLDEQRCAVIIHTN